MKRKYEKNLIINPNCSIKTSLQIKQSHLFTQKEEDKTITLMKKYNITNKNILFIQGKTDNKSYVRIVLPKNAVIETQPNLTIQKFENYQLVDFYTHTRRLETITNTINYTIPNKNCRKYDFSLYKQSGIKEYDLNIIKDENITENYGLKGDYYYK
jgi:hypothetical protein